MALAREHMNFKREGLQQANTAHAAHNHITGA
jgi:hypothetical protein